MYNIFYDSAKINFSFQPTEFNTSIGDYVVNYPIPIKIEITNNQNQIFTFEGGFIPNDSPRVSFVYNEKRKLPAVTHDLSLIMRMYIQHGNEIGVIGDWLEDRGHFEAAVDLRRTFLG